MNTEDRGDFTRSGPLGSVILYVLCSVVFQAYASMGLVMRCFGGGPHRPYIGGARLQIVGDLS
jgi:hypothetical protein